MYKFVFVNKLYWNTHTHPYTQESSLRSALDTLENYPCKDVGDTRKVRRLSPVTLCNKRGIYAITKAANAFQNRAKN